MSRKDNNGNILIATVVLVVVGFLFLPAVPVIVVVYALFMPLECFLAYAIINNKSNIRAKRQTYNDRGNAL